MHSGCENEPIDLEGLHESVVDSDEDLADSMDVSFINGQTKEPRDYMHGCCLFRAWPFETTKFEKP